jgi:hypothetical protein
METPMPAKDQSTKSPLPNVNPAEVAEMGKKQVDAVIEMQKEFVKSMEEANRAWAARVKAETDLAAEFSGKLTAARSIPEAAAIYQEWMGKRMELFAEDSQRFVADIQKFAASAARLLPKGWPGGSS